MGIKLPIDETIGSFQYIEIQLDNKAKRTQTKKVIIIDNHVYSFLFVSFGPRYQGEGFGRLLKIHSNRQCLQLNQVHPKIRF